MRKTTNQAESKIKLYSLLVDELFRHQTNIWQTPTALVSVNFVVIHSFKCQCYPLIALFIFNAGMVFVFCQMVKSQYRIMDTIKNAEATFNPTLAAFLPKIEIPKKIFYSPFVFVWILVSLELFLAGYIWFLCVKHIC